MANDLGQQKYNAPPATASTIGDVQFNEHFYYKKALIEAMRTQVFQPMADTRAMPKHMGKKIVQYHYLPLLDDENDNDQGIDATGATTVNGNLYGSSKDIGTITGKLPLVGETGGRVNRVGFRRKQIEGTMQKMGFFDEYTEDSLNFDTDAQLKMHINREMMNGASEITEDALQIDILNNAGVVKFPGAITSIATVDNTPITYGDLLRLSIDLDNNRTPKQITRLTGTRMIDTRTIAGARVMYIGTELQQTFEEMVDFHGNPAFIPVHKYAANKDTINMEIGSVGYFRLVVVPEMLKHEGAGAALAANDTEHFETDGNYDVFPMLVIGEGSFTTIGFQTDGKSTKYIIKHKKPNETHDRVDPYGETGFMSIKWWYGFMLLRGERLAVVWSAGKM